MGSAKYGVKKGRKNTGCGDGGGGVVVWADGR